jgi:hypothetical protein
LYAFLGHVYATAATINGNSGLRSLLVQDVDQLLNEDRQSKRRWEASKHDTFDLLLTLRFKLAPDTAVLKSGWLAALRVANEWKDDVGNPNPIEATEQAFVDWITPIGVSGAKKHATKGDTFDLCAFAEGVESDSASFTVDLPADAVPPEGMLLILGRVVGQNGDKADVSFVDVIVNERRVKSISAWAAKQWERSANAAGKSFTRKVDKALKQEFGDPGAPHETPDSSRAGADFLADVANSI